MFGVLNIAFLIVFAFPRSKENKTPSFENRVLAFIFQAEMFIAILLSQRNFDGEDV